MTATDFDVVIVGAGPSGLALALELGTRDVRCLVVERNDRVGYAPRAKTTNVRTRTHLRRWGIAQRLAELSPFGVDYPSDIVFATRLSGPRLARIANASNCDPSRSDLYPEHAQWVPQYTLERVMRERVESLPSVTLTFGTEFISADQNETHVVVVLHDADSGSNRSVSCRYAVGADGSRSTVRNAIGATMQGKHALSRNYNVVFRAPALSALHEHGQATMYWQVNPAAPSLIGPMDRDDVWFFMPTRLPPDTKITSDNAADLIRASTGLDFELEVISCDEWIASSLIADRYRLGRVFLIGDACHLHPPFGGYGMNMGVADGVDLGWKLSAVLQGWGGPALLHSYELERRRAHAEVIAEASANHAVLSNDLWSDGLEDPGGEGERLRAEAGAKIVALKRREFETLGTVLGGRYGPSPILPHGVAPPSDSETYVPASTPGSLAPHVWLEDGSSLYDGFGLGFALIVGPQASAADIAAARDDAAAVGIPLTVITLSSCEAGRLYPVPITLVRPDQYVAWRGTEWSAKVLERASGMASDAQ